MRLEKRIFAAEFFWGGVGVGGGAESESGWGVTHGIRRGGGSVRGLHGVMTRPGTAFRLGRVGEIASEVFVVSSF